MQFVHDDSNFVPAYSVEVSDGVTTIGPASATIYFTEVNDDAPTIDYNSLTITEGATVTLVATDLSATDADPRFLFLR